MKTFAQDVSGEGHCEKYCFTKILINLFIEYLSCSCCFFLQSYKGEKTVNDQMKCAVQRYNEVWTLCLNYNTEHWLWSLTDEVRRGCVPRYGKLCDSIKIVLNGTNKIC